MNLVCSLNRCTGCMACVDLCAKHAIHIEDSIEAYNAVIDENLCVHCGACHNICQNNQEIQYEAPILWKQGWRRDPDLRAASSSGGAAASLMSTFLKQYGSVCSCTFADERFRFDFLESAEDICKFTGSKYVKSNPAGVYRQIKKKLLAGESVLFIGLPCQVEAVKLFVGKRLLPGLYTVDLICHGSPSPKLLNQFLEEHNASLRSSAGIEFRRKNKFHLFQNSPGGVPERITDTYTHAFLNCLDYTENCYTCRYARKERVSDISIGDSWGSELSQEEQNKGISLILCQSEKGRELLQASDMVLLDVDAQKATAYNTQLRHPSERPGVRDRFLEFYRRTRRFSISVALCYPGVFMKQYVKKLLIKMRIMK